MMIDQTHNAVPVCEIFRDNAVLAQRIALASRDVMAMAAKPFLADHERQVAFYAAKLSDTKSAHIMIAALKRVQFEESVLCGKSEKYALGNKLYPRDYELSFKDAPVLQTENLLQSLHHRLFLVSSAPSAVVKSWGKTAKALQDTGAKLELAYNLARIDALLSQSPLPDSPAVSLHISRVVRIARELGIEDLGKPKNPDTINLAPDHAFWDDRLLAEAARDIKLHGLVLNRLDKEIPLRRQMVNLQIQGMAPGL